MQAGFWPGLIEGRVAAARGGHEGNAIDDLINEAADLGNAGENTAALAAFEHILTIDSDCVVAACGRAMAMFNLGRREEAAALSRKLLRSYPHDAHVHRQAADIHFASGRFDEAIAACDKSIALACDASDNWTAGFGHFARADMLSRRNRLPEAVTSFGLAIHFLGLSESDSLQRVVTCMRGVCTWLADVHRDRGDDTSAAMIYRDILTLNDHASSGMGLGAVASFFHTLLEHAVNRFPTPHDVGFLDEFYDQAETENAGNASRVVKDKPKGGTEGRHKEHSVAVTEERDYTGDIMPNGSLSLETALQHVARSLGRPVATVRAQLGVDDATHETTRRAKAKPRALWENRKGADAKLTPPEFIAKHYAAEMAAGTLHRGLIGQEDKPLAVKLANWLRTHPMPEGVDIPTLPEWNTRQLATLEGGEAELVRLYGVARRRRDKTAAPAAA